MDCHWHSNWRRFVSSCSHLRLCSLGSHRDCRSSQGEHAPFQNASTPCTGHFNGAMISSHLLNNGSSGTLLFSLAAAHTMPSRTSVAAEGTRRVTRCVELQHYSIIVCCNRPVRRVSNHDLSCWKRCASMDWHAWPSKERPERAR